MHTPEVISVIHVEHDVILFERVRRGCTPTLSVAALLMPGGSSPRRGVRHRAVGTGTCDFTCSKLLAESSTCLCADVPIANLP